MCGETAFCKKAVLEETSATSPSPPPIKGRWVARLLGGLICNSQPGAWRAGACLSPGALGLPCLAGEAGRAMALGRGHALETVRARDVWVAGGAWRQEAGGQCPGGETCTCQSEGPSREPLKRR